MKIKKAIILAGGTGTRLKPITSIINKHLLNIYDKPLIYYPISTVLLAGIRQILIIASKDQINFFKMLLGNGQLFGMNISYEIQNEPNGLPEAFIIGEKFIGNDPICLNLGDHILFGQGLPDLLETTFSNFKKNTIFSLESLNTKDYGVVELNKKRKPIKIIEKPKRTKSKNIITGIYAFSNEVISISKKLKKSSRSELEISDLINHFLKKNELDVSFLGRGIAWFDAGSSDRILEASNFIQLIQKNQGNLVGCLEEIALNKKFISLSTYMKSIDLHKNSQYGEYLKSIIR
tara:strand:+ start:900 stop:1772 length:873 start_codon:yes stop_codon:yes gene_type:complete